MLSYVFCIYLLYQTFSYIVVHHPWIWSYIKGGVDPNYNIEKKPSCLVELICGGFFNSLIGDTMGYSNMVIWIEYGDF